MREKAKAKCSIGKMRRGIRDTKARSQREGRWHSVESIRLERLLEKGSVEEKSDGRDGAVRTP